MARANLTRASIVATAADLSDRDGFDAISVSALARHVGVQPASLYSHVRDRAAVLDGVHELALAELAGRIADQTAGRSGRDALAGLANAHRDYAHAHPGRWTALQRPAAPRTVASEAARRLVSFTWAVLRAYVPADEDLVHATRFVGAAINGFVTLEQTSAFGQRHPDVEVSWWQTIDALDRALRSWPHEGSEEEPS